MVVKILFSALLAVGVAAAPSAPYASWAHSHFVWYSSDQCLAPACTTALLDAYEAHNITVGAVDIDSGWATGFNTFVPSPSLYPDWASFVRSLHARGVRVILWMTSFIDVDSPNYADALTRDAFVHDGFNEPALNLSWWHGKGGLLDYTSEATRAWWEGQMRTVLTGDAGSSIDGWKCDGSDPYVIELLTPRGADGTYFTFEEYSAFYYGHTLNFSRTLVPDALIWSRPVDAFPVALNISAFLEYSPKNVMFSGWVGDQDPTFEGLRAAAINILESAWRGYLNFGSDTGGYRSGDRSREVFIRWAQLNAFLPLFENGGNGDHTPWFFDSSDGTTQVCDMYRMLVNMHYSLVPYLLSYGAAAYAQGVSIITPTSQPPVDFPFILQPDLVKDWSYSLGPHMFLSPVLFTGVTSINVTLPSSGGSAPWVDVWDPTRTFPPGTTVVYHTPLQGGGPLLRNAAFLRGGTLIPLHVSCATPLMPGGDVSWAPALTLLAQGVGEGGEGSAAEVDIVLEGAGEGSRTQANVHAALRTSWSGGERGEGQVTLTLSPSTRPVILVLRRSHDRGWPHSPHSHHHSSSQEDAPTEEEGHGRVRSVQWRRVGEAVTEAAVTFSERAAPSLRNAHEKARVAAALAWEGTAPGGGRFPLSNALALADAFESLLSGTFTRHVTATWEEVTVFCGATFVSQGANVSIAWGA